MDPQNDEVDNNILLCFYWFDKYINHDSFINVPKDATKWGPLSDEQLPLKLIKMLTNSFFQLLLIYAISIESIGVVKVFWQNEPSGPNHISLKKQTKNKQQTTNIKDCLFMIVLWSFWNISLNLSKWTFIHNVFTRRNQFLFLWEYIYITHVQKTKWTRRFLPLIIFITFPLMPWLRKRTEWAF